MRRDATMPKPIQSVLQRLIFCVFAVIVGLSVGVDVTHADDTALLTRTQLGGEAPFSGQLSMRLAGGAIGEDGFVTVTTGAFFAYERFRGALCVPLRLRVVDQGSSDAGVLRARDWDEISDFARLVPLLQYGTVDDPYMLRVGDLSAVSLGHGSIVRGYSSSPVIDHYHGGLYGRIDLGYVGTEILVNDVFAPTLLAGRAYGRPLSVLKTLPGFLRRLSLGLTLAVDFQAPTQVAVGEFGGIAVDATRTPIVLSTESPVLFGADLELPWAVTDDFDVVTYGDLNLADGDALGVHAGLWVNIRFNPLVTWRTRLELRSFEGGYVPGYLSSFYEIERYRYRDMDTKLSWMKAARQEPWSWGALVESELSFDGLMRFSVLVADDEGRDNSELQLRVDLPEIYGFRARVLYARVGFHGIDDVLEPEATLVAASARYAITQEFFASARLVNAWRMSDADIRGRGFRTSLDFDLGLGLSLGW